MSSDLKCKRFIQNKDNNTNERSVHAYDTTTIEIQPLLPFCYILHVITDHCSLFILHVITDIHRGPELKIVVYSPKILVSSEIN